MTKKLFFLNWKVNIIKAPAGFELMTYRLVVNALTHCATVFCNKVGKKITRLYLILLFISVRCLSQSEGVLYHGNNEMKWILILLLKRQPFIENNTLLRWQNWFHHLTCYRVETNLIMERHSCLKIWYVIIHGEIYKKKKNRFWTRQQF